MGAGIAHVLLAAGLPVTLVEVVRGRATSPEALAAVHRLAGLAGNETIEIADSPGFATSRLGVAIGLEGIRMVQEGVGTPEDIDKAMVLGHRYPMGPLRLGDLVGLDVRLSITEYLHARLGDRFDPSCCDAWSPRAGWEEDRARLRRLGLTAAPRQERFRSRDPMAISADPVDLQANAVPTCSGSGGSPQWSARAPRRSREGRS
jgi:hypothetical protein